MQAFNQPIRSFPKSTSFEMNMHSSDHCRRRINWLDAAACTAIACCIMLVCLGFGVIIWYTAVAQPPSNGPGFRAYPVRWPPSEVKEISSKLETAPASPTNHSIATQTTVNSTSPTEHAKPVADRLYCDRLIDYRRLKAIKDREEEFCCEIYVKHACNETIEPSDLRKYTMLCKFGTPRFFYKACILEEKLSDNLKLTFPI